ncbi:MAG: single-stranded DNA-binding protein [Acidobacteria bacterium]|nr:single-stranded DNA-binding protein [Acidobacteriota bacterium]
MASFNKIIIVGYLGRDPEIRYVPSGEAVCSFSMATTDKKKDGTDETTWFRVTIWGRRGETANQYLSKGKQVYIEGRLRQQEYTDRDGNKRTSLEVTASDFQFLGARDGDGGGDSSAPRPSPAARPSSSNPLSAPPPMDEGGVQDSDIPF